jgi:hypothetical protein
MTATRRPSVNEGRLDQHCRGVGEGVTIAEERALASVAEAKKEGGGARRRRLPGERFRGAAAGVDCNLGCLQ